MPHGKFFSIILLSGVGILIPLSSLVLTPLASAASIAVSPPELYVQSGLASSRRGDFEDAISQWTEAARLYERDGKSKEQVSVLIHLANAYHAIGEHKLAIAKLEAALALARPLGDPTQMALILNSRGNVYVTLGVQGAAQTDFEQALQLAKQTGNSGLTADILNNFGNLLSSQKKYPDAIRTYSETVILARASSNRALAAGALSNAASASMLNGQYRESKALLDSALEDALVMEEPHGKAFTLVNIGLTYRGLRQHLPDLADSLLLLASKTFTQAAALAEESKNRRTESYAWGYLGQLYEDERRYEEALQLTRRAVFAAQQVNAVESLYRWQWQSGRILKKMGSPDDAISAYRRALNGLQSIRPELLGRFSNAQESFRESVGAVYFELVDLLLQKAASLQNVDEGTPYLIEARQTVELFKVAELRDYFQDDCVDTALAKATNLDDLARTAVVVYPILLRDRIELLVSLPSGLKRFTVAVDAETVTQEVRVFRRYLEKRTTREYLPHAQKLYDWLIRPLEKEFATLRIETLVFVPDGPLRTLPMAALHDGKKFLVDKYALAITPGLSLTDPHPIDRDQVKLLAVGVTESVQGFPPLPDVGEEIEEIRTLFGGATLVDKEFLVPAFEQKLKDNRYTIMHIASHAQVENNIEDTFLLTFDEKLTMNRLDQYIGLFKFRDEPLELLTLSACETAAGDDRAALGLAGIAIKAGARSAVATLWNINDAASSELIVEFYRQLKDPTVSRALALQRAQSKLLHNPRFDHPGFWSPYLLINTWL
jgi:CHAT domain-containing protein/Tfp pilus assembly protein PilF